MSERGAVSVFSAHVRGEDGEQCGTHLGELDSQFKSSWSQGSVWTVAGESLEQPATPEGVTGLPDSSPSPFSDLDSEAAALDDRANTDEQSALGQPRSKVRSTYHLREANRAITVATLLDEEPQLEAERKELVQKKYRSSLTKSETRRLKYIEWQLDRIEDVHVGPQLDRLEEFTTSYERFAQDLDRSLEQLSSLMPTRKGRRGGK